LAFPGANGNRRVHARRFFVDQKAASFSPRGETGGFPPGSARARAPAPAGGGHAFVASCALVPPLRAYVGHPPVDHVLLRHEEVLLLPTRGKLPRVLGPEGVHDAVLERAGEHLLVGDPALGPEAHHVHGGHCAASPMSGPSLSRVAASCPGRPLGSARRVASPPVRRCPSVRVRVGTVDGAPRKPRRARFAPRGAPGARSSPRAPLGRAARSIDYGESDFIRSSPRQSASLPPPRR